MQECRDIFLSFIQKTWRGWLKEYGPRCEDNIKIEIKETNRVLLFMHKYVAIWAGFIRFRK
jgi:hypothetical protein